MESLLGPIVTALVQLGAPYILGAVFIVLYFLERKRNHLLADKLYDLGMASVKAITETQGTLKTVEKDIDALGRRVQ